MEEVVEHRQLPDNDHLASRRVGANFFFFQAEDGIRAHCVTGVQTCALPISRYPAGTKNAAPNWAKFTQPVLDAMASVPDLPRGPKMSAQNFEKQHAYAAAAASAKKNK